METWFKSKLFQLKSVHVSLSKENCNSSHTLPDPELTGNDSSEVFFIHSDLEPVNSSVSFSSSSAYIDKLFEFDVLLREIKLIRVN